ncbi:MAG: GNAT family N-acetyltransferase [Cyanobacteria bacterium P01_F01_bin.116]
MTSISWPIRIETERLVLRQIEPGDYQAWYDAMLRRRPCQHKYDDSLVEFDGLDSAWFAQICKEFHQSALDDEAYRWNVYHQQTGQQLGQIGLSTIQRSVFQWANLGYIIHNQFWRQGFAKEAVTAVLKAGFEQLHYHRIEAAINLDNYASIGLVESLDLQKECIRRSFWYENEQWVDHLIYVALPSNFGLSESEPTVS